MLNYSKIFYYWSRLNFKIFIKIITYELFVKLLKDFSLKYSFSHTGEDLHIISLFNDKKNGFYVEVGSNNPITHSNTFKLYLNGWNGILIDANPNLIDLSKRIRKKDICINALISNESRGTNFYISKNSNFSSIHKNHVENNDGIQDVIKMQTYSLDNILQDNLHSFSSLDLLMIDVEGHDLEVLKSIDLNKYKPTLIVIEDLEFDYLNPFNNEICKYLFNFGYKLISIDKLNLYFKK